MTDPAKDITHLANALKAPRIRVHATRLADLARTDGWSYEEYLAAVLGREVPARDAWCRHANPVRRVPHP